MADDFSSAGVLAEPIIQDSDLAVTEAQTSMLPNTGKYFYVDGAFFDNSGADKYLVKLVDAGTGVEFDACSYSRKERKTKFIEERSAIVLNFPSKGVFEGAVSFLKHLPDFELRPRKRGKGSVIWWLVEDGRDGAEELLSSLKGIFDAPGMPITINSTVPLGSPIAKTAPPTTVEALMGGIDRALEVLATAKRGESPSESTKASESDATINDVRTDLRSAMPIDEVRLDLAVYRSFYETKPEVETGLSVAQAFELVTSHGRPYVTLNKNYGPYFTGPMGIAPWVKNTKEKMDKAREVDPTVPYEGIQRSASHSLGGSMFKFDLDGISEVDLALARKRLSASGLAARMFTTYSHGVEGKGNRYRVVVVADRQASVEEFKCASEFLGRELFSRTYDKSEHDPYQQAGVWMTHPDREHLATLEKFDGAAVSLDKVLAFINDHVPPETLSGATWAGASEAEVDALTKSLMGERDSVDPLPVWDDAVFETLKEILTHEGIHDIASPDWNDTQGQVLSALKRSVELTPYEYQRLAEERCRALCVAYALNNRRGYTREQAEADWDGDKFGGFSRSPFYIVSIGQKLGINCDHITGKSRKTAGAIKGDVKLVRASEITAEPIRWLWEGQLAKGKIHILGGKPGTSKTTIAMNLAAITSSGGKLPDGKQCGAGNVLVWSGEDDPKDTLVPRLIANGADTDRVFFVDATLDVDGKMLPFDPARDIARLQETAKGLGDVSMVIVDPIVSAVGGDGNSNSEVRRDLQPLVDLAENLDCAVLGITHFTKGSGGQAAVDRITGSLAFGAVARIIHVCFRPKDKTDGEFAFMRGKSNISAVGGGFLYDIEQVYLPGTVIEASRIKWRGTISGLVEIALASAEADEKDKPAMETAKDFLLEHLKDGPAQSSELKAVAKDEGISESALHRAAKDLNIQKSRWGFGKNSISWWNLLTMQWPSDWEQRKQDWLAKKGT